MRTDDLLMCNHSAGYFDHIQDSLIGKDHCVLCAEPVDVKKKDSRKVETFGFEDRLQEVCFARGYDDWAMEVQGRLESCIDLPAEVAVYHSSCHARFCCCQSKARHVVVGRPVKTTAQQALDRLCGHLETYCDNNEMYTLDGLRTVMMEWGYRDQDAYGTRSIKNKLKERYGEHM